MRSCRVPHLLLCLLCVGLTGARWGSPASGGNHWPETAWQLKLIWKRMRLFPGWCPGRRCTFPRILSTGYDDVISGPRISRTGLIQIGKDSLFIQPVGDHDPSQSFSGIKHQLLRHHCFPKNNPGQCAGQPIHCGTVEGEKKKRKPKLSEDDRRKRNTMNLHKTYTLETMVVADFDMVQYHGAEVAQRFLLTIMNMVDNMFQHRSLGVKVDIRVSKLVLLHTRPEKLKISHHGQRSLESFCQWQYQEFGIPQYLGTNRITSGRYDVPPVDTAVLVT
ncbi:hypothetical protein XENOCAPTIV_020222, partial [Xenoophorus captivus]